VGILRGGSSAEYDISLQSGASALKALNSQHTPIEIFIDRKGVWHIAGLPVSLDQVARRVDVILNCLHGTYGEDGTLQRELDSFNISYTGSGALSSALGMHKVRTKDMYRSTGIRTPEWAVIHADGNLQKQLHEAFTNVPSPYFVKPVSSGSSVGVFKAHDFFSLEEAVARAFTYASSLIIEEAIQGREATCGVIDGFRGESHYALLPVEIIPAPGRDFFDYTSKYSGESKELCPGGFSEEETKAIQDAAIEAHRVLGLRHYSRTDMIVTRGYVYALETNTLPGLTEESLLPKSIDAVGSNLEEFLDHIITLALQK
jgi:D-alanine-D-alanine ligase